MSLQLHTVRFVAWRWAFNGACRYLSPKLQKAVPHAWNLLGNLFMMGWLVRMMTFPATSHYRNVWQLDSYQGPERIASLDGYLQCDAAWYIAGIINSVIHGESEISMLVHHVIAVVLIQTCLACNITRMGIALAPFVLFSNPLLHAAKLLHCVGSGAKDAAFACFAVVFFVTRVAAYPIMYLRVSLFEQHWMRDRIYLYFTVNTLLLAIYVLQLLWFNKIVRILCK